MGNKTVWSWGSEMQKVGRVCHIYTPSLVVVVESGWCPELSDESHFPSTGRSTENKAVASTPQVVGLQVCTRLSVPVQF
jgi:hypothetical protein